MATWDDVRRIALALPETTEDGSAWKVKGKTFAWERPLRKSDLKALDALGETPPDGPILGARVPDVGAKDALIADDPDVYFTIPHFDGYPGILVKLDNATAEDLDELLTEAWLERAPKRLARDFLDSR